MNNWQPSESGAPAFAIPSLPALSNRKPGRNSSRIVTPQFVRRPSRVARLNHLTRHHTVERDVIIEPHLRHHPGLSIARRLGALCQRYKILDRRGRIPLLKPGRKVPHRCVETGIEPFGCCCAEAHPAARRISVNLVTAPIVSAGWATRIAWPAREDSVCMSDGAPRLATYPN